MEEQLIGKQLAVFAKQKGFPQNISLHEYRSDGSIGYSRMFISRQWDDSCEVKQKIITESIDRFSAPTQALLQKWLREVHKLHIEIIPDETSVDAWYAVVYHMYKMSETLTLGPYDSYEKALEEGLSHELNLLEDVTRADT